MNRLKKLVAVLAATVLVTSIVAAYLWLELRTEREQNRELAARVAALESAQLAQASMPRPLEPLAPPVAAVTGPQAAAGQTVPASAAEPAAREQPDRRGANPLIAGLREAVSSPEGREFARSMMRGMLPRQYPDLARELDLTQQEAEQFFDLLAKHQDALGVDSMGLLAGGVQDPAARQEMQRRLVEKQQANEAELAAMLGSRYPKWQEYQSTAVARREVNELRAALSSSNPLSEAQSKALITALAAEQARIQQEERNWAASAGRDSANMIEEQLQRVTEGNRRLFDVAAAHLDSVQLDLYRRQREEVTNMALGMMRAIGAPGSEQRQVPAATPGAP